MIPYGRQDISQEDIDAVTAVLKSDFLTQGPAVPRFEQTVSNYCDAKYAVAVNSATSALHIACLALGVGKGDVVWTSPITFVASANCALYCGASVDFVDIDAQTYNMCPERLAEKLAEAKKIDKLPKVVIPVHMCGQSCDMERIYKLGQQYGFKILEDASHAIGGRYNGLPIGNCQFSDIAVFSFHPVKIVTTGEGGMAVTNDEHLAKRMRVLRSHGISSALEDMHERSPDEIWNYQQIELGFNYRMTDIQAALGNSQMVRLDDFVTRRQFLAMRYESLLSNLPIITPIQRANQYSAFHLYVVRLKLSDTNRNQREIFESLKDRGVIVNLHYIPVYRQPHFEKMGFLAGYCPKAEEYFSEAITLPLYPGLTEFQQDQVASSFEMALS
ncbi:UDP-4-amino-4,6-dideoxy-N-acetyl-beta-L-altrosamine transaminase [Limnohabitans sp. Rim11]|uniref:UDP-4-amino-4, 6-dideoxy-N-acetyl-beta-L-altrosamine transaminase n=1 Tax=Limnohabitans sp. Rim11 TaxID=1100719 RepID=UPI000AB6B986|nr:UDP-4-amino-4,6-dideoxy-N-acetyl-beta-L-altrosamine transaminase [Limnohabitans sp. Rim11]